MKRRLFSIVMIAFGVLVACNKVEPVITNTENEAEEVKEYSFTASLPSNTKVSVDDALNAFWVKGDAISVETNNGYTTFSLQGNGGSNQGVFKAKSKTPKDGGIAVYPTANFSDGSYTFRPELTYSLDEDARVISTVPAVGIVSYKNNELNASMRHVAGAIRVTFKEVPLNAQYMILSTDKKITGTTTVTGTKALKLTGDPNNTNNKVTVSFPNEYREEMTFIIPIPEGEYNKISFVLKDRNDTDIPGTNKSTKDGNSYNIAAGHVRTFIINPDRVDVYTFEELLPGESINLEEADKYIYVYEESFDEATGIGAGKFSGDDNKREAVDCVIKMQDNGNGQRKTIQMYYADYITSYHFYSGEQITIDKKTYTKYNVQTSKTDDYGNPYVWTVIVDNSGEYVKIQTVYQDYNNKWHITNNSTLHYIPYDSLTWEYKQEESCKNGLFQYSGNKSNIHIYKIVTKKQ